MCSPQDYLIFKVVNGGRGYFLLKLKPRHKKYSNMKFRIHFDTKFELKSAKGSNSDALDIPSPEFEESLTMDFISAVRKNALVFLGPKFTLYEQKFNVYVLVCHHVYGTIRNVNFQLVARTLDSKIHEIHNATELKRIYTPTRAKINGESRQYIKFGFTTTSNRDNGAVYLMECTVTTDTHKYALILGPFVILSRKIKQRQKI